MDVKPFASLTATLLARKGQAKPAMRPQGYAIGAPFEDLGWNDMGDGKAASLPAMPAPAPAQPPADTPPILQQQMDLAERLNGDSVPELASKGRSTAAPARAKPARSHALPRVNGRAQPGLKAKSAFTLRLDSERHLRLRLACAVSHRSAQQIVTEALDEYLAAIPEIETLAGKLPPRAKQ